jgi:hypothetical protein
LAGVGAKSRAGEAHATGGTPHPTDRAADQPPGTTAGTSRTGDGLNPREASATTPPTDGTHPNTPNANHTAAQPPEDSGTPPAANKVPTVQPNTDPATGGPGTANRNTDQRLTSPGTANPEARALTRDQLSPVQASNLNRYQKKLPAAAEETKITSLPDGSVQFETRVPGRVPGSYALYTKTVGRDGKTIGYEKTTIVPDGSVAHIKDKMKN